MKTDPQIYAIEGEEVTLDQIIERAERVGLQRHHVRSRLHFGDRTWARLLRAPNNKPDRMNRVFFGRNRQGRK